MTSKRIHAMRLVACGCALLAAACGSSNPPRSMPSVPVSNVLDTAANPAFRTIDAMSFKTAYVSYPADDGHHRVPVGDYLATRIAEAFPRAAETENLRLLNYEARCEEEGFLSSDVVCRIVGDFRFRLWRAPKRISFQMSEVSLGDPVDAETEAYAVSNDPRADAFGWQIRRVVDISAEQFRKELQLVLVEMNRKQFF